MISCGVFGAFFKKPGFDFQNLNPIFILVHGMDIVCSRLWHEVETNPGYNQRWKLHVN